MDQHFCLGTNCWLLPSVAAHLGAVGLSSTDGHSSCHLQQGEPIMEINLRQMIKSKCCNVKLHGEHCNIQYYLKHFLAWLHNYCAIIHVSLSCSLPLPSPSRSNATMPRLALWQKRLCQPSGRCLHLEGRKGSAKGECC